MPQFEGFQGRVPPGLDTLRPDSIAQLVPSFSTVQNVADEDAVLVGHWKYAANALETIERLYDVVRDPLEKENLIEDPAHTRIASCLRETLRDFRYKQITYYRSPEVRASFFPPKYRMASFYCDPGMLEESPSAGR